MADDRRRAKLRKLTAEGNYVTHSDIMNRKGGSVTAFRNIGASGTKDLDGGRAATIADTAGYQLYIFYVAPMSSIGKKQIEGGNKTVVVNTGTLFVTVETKEKGKGKTYSGTAERYDAGQVLNLKKGQRYTYSAGKYECELLVVESGDLTEKVLEQPLANLNGAQQFQVARRPGVDIANLKQRKRMSPEEREAYGNVYAAARGQSTPQEKRKLAQDIAKGKESFEMPQSVVGINPTPIGEIGDDYLPSDG